MKNQLGINTIHLTLTYKSIIETRFVENTIMNYDL